MPVHRREGPPRHEIGAVSQRRQARTQLDAVVLGHERRPLLDFAAAGVEHANVADASDERLAERQADLGRARGKQRVGRRVRLHQHGVSQGDRDRLDQDRRRQQESEQGDAKRVEAG